MESCQGLSAQKPQCSLLHIDDYPALLQRSIGCLQKLDNSPTSLTTIKRLSIIQDTVDKVLCLDSECLCLLDPWRPHVARAIAHQQVIDVLRVCQADPLVVNFDLLVSFKVVPYQHLLLTADQRGSDFYG